MARGPKKKRATYQDISNAPEHMVAEIVGGELRLSPRPRSPGNRVASKLVMEIGGPFDGGHGGPGGWVIMTEPELKLGEEIAVPDLAGWTRERMPVVPDEQSITLRPDWVCEVLSKSTERMDRLEKMPLYAASGIPFAWLVHPRHRSIEVFRLQRKKWLAIATHKDSDRARIEPFDAIEFDVARLWADLPLPTRASEEAVDYAW